MDFSNNKPASTAAPTPVVLQIMPLLGSAAPIGYIYDPQRTLNGKWGLLAAAAAFFSHQGHQIFYDPCPDLAAYRTGRGVTAMIINVDWLPDHVLLAGLDLLDATPSPPNADALGTSFMVAYLTVPAPAAPWAISLRPPWGVIPSKVEPSPSIAMGGLKGALVRFTLPPCHSPLPQILLHWLWHFLTLQLYTQGDPARILNRT
jgi:hypothetical protein